MDTRGRDIRFACAVHGARRVFVAAKRRMAGDRWALATVGLADVATFDEADSISLVCLRLMNASEREAELAEPSISLVKLRSVPDTIDPALKH